MDRLVGRPFVLPATPAAPRTVTGSELIHGGPGLPPLHPPSERTLTDAELAAAVPPAAQAPRTSAPTLIGPEVAQALAPAAPAHPFSQPIPATSPNPQTDPHLYPVPPPAYARSDDRGHTPRLRWLRGLPVTVAVVLVLAGLVLLPPAEGTRGTSTTSMNLQLVVEGAIQCNLGPVVLNLASQSTEAGRFLTTRAEGFAVPAATGDENCGIVNEALGLPSAATSLELRYRSPQRPGPVAMEYISEGGVLRVGNTVELSLPAGNGTLAGSRNPLTGKLSGALTIEPFSTEIAIPAAGPVAVDVAIDTEPVSGVVPPGSGVMVLVLGALLAAHTAWTSPGFTSARNRIPGTRWYRQRPHITWLSVTWPSAVAVALAVWAAL